MDDLKNEINRTRRDNLVKLKEENRFKNKHIAAALGCSNSFITWLLKPIEHEKFRPLSDNHIKKIVKRYGKECNFDASYFDGGAEKTFGAQKESLKTIKALKSRIIELEELLRENKELKTEYKKKADQLELLVQSKDKEYNDLIDAFWGRTRKTDKGSKGNGKAKRTLPPTLTPDPQI